MTLKDNALSEIESARERFLQLLDSIPETDYPLPSDNPAWTVGDVLYHITLGPRAVAVEMWMIVHARGLYQLVMKRLPLEKFNKINAWFTGRKSGRFTRAGLAKMYENAHAGLESMAKRAREEDFARSVVYPSGLAVEIEGQVSVARLCQYARQHVDLHAAQIGKIRV